MAKHYRKRGSSVSDGGLSRLLVVTLAAFFVGYLSATYFDVRQVIKWLGSSPSVIPSMDKVPESTAQLPKPKLEFYTLLTANHGAEAAIPPLPSAPSSPPAANTTASVLSVTPGSTPAHSEIGDAGRSPQSTPTPVIVSRPAPVPVAKPANPHIQPVAANKPAFTIQVAAFRMPQDAERMKVSLLLKGFEVSVNPVASQGETWFRVMVGPFGSLAQAEKVQVALARRERVNGMIRRMDA